MPLVPGTCLGPYEVTGALGAGGMGEVYRARDSSLKRQVALKVLPEGVADNPERLARFEREALILAQLNHPNIAQIYGIEQAVPTANAEPGHAVPAPATPVRALVMELVEGPTLEDRLRAGAIPIDEALLIARQIADALEAAHEQGVIHRDLKPANVKVRGDGDVKVLDFGIAKTHEVNREALATVTTPAATQAGTILGTAAYMSPEQARGRAVDRRADIWAYGCVLFEMLTGTRPFDGETVTDTLAAVVTRDPEWTALPTGTPPHVRALLARCLVKDPKQRLRDIGDARLELTGSPLGVVAISEEAARAPRKAPTWVPWLLAAAAAAIAGVALVRPAWLPIAPAPRDDQAAVTRFVVLPPLGTLDAVGTVRAAGQFEISPDGRRVAMLATAPGGRLWIRDFSTLDPAQVRDTDQASRPFWSPDGRSVGYFAAGHLHTVDLSTSTQFRLTPSEAFGATWNADGVVLFAYQNTIHRIAASGGATGAVTVLDKARGDRQHAWPVFLPDNRQFLFLAVTSDERTTGIYLGSIDTKETRFLTAAASNAAYAPPGYLVFARGATLVALAFDPETGAVSGEPQNVARRVAYNPTTRHAEFSVSRTGVLTHSAATFGDVLLAWFDRSGARVGGIDAISHMDISPDDALVAADRFDPETGMRDVWVFDEKRGTRSRLTFSPVNDWVPVWSADGKRILYTSDHETPGTGQIYQRAADGSGREELVLKTGAHKHHMDVSRDGRLLVFQEEVSSGKSDVWILSLAEAGGVPTPVLNGPYDENQPSFSPDGRLLAYTSNESGAFEVYVRSLAAGGRKWQISTNGGIQPRWRRDGREMYYLAADGKIMALDVNLPGPAFGTPRALFQSRVFGDITTEHFSVTSDGRRFLMNDVSSAASAGFVVVQNWWRELER